MFGQLQLILLHMDYIKEELFIDTWLMNLIIIPKKII